MIILVLWVLQHIVIVVYLESSTGTTQLQKDSLYITESDQLTFQGFLNDLCDPVNLLHSYDT